MTERKREPQRVDIYRTRPIERDPLPSAEEIAEKLDQHPQAVKIREGRFSDWIGKPLSDGIWTAWGMKARVDKRGLTWSAINEISHIGDPPEVGEPHLTQVRYVKAYPLLPEEMREKMSPKWGGHREIEHKYEVWSDETPALVEEALSRRWYAGRDIAWKEMSPLPDDLERAFDQYLTYLIQCQLFCSDLIGPYIGRISYGFPEVKSILAYEMFDYNVHAGMLRKRAISNGGGIGAYVDGIDAGVVEVANEASNAFQGEVERDLNAVVLGLQVFFNGVVLELLRLGEAAAQTEFDRGLLARMVQDEARHVSWGCSRLRYYLDHCPDREAAALHLHEIADRLESEQTANHLLNPKVLEPLAILLGGGPEGVERGWDVLREFWPQIAERYEARMAGIGLPRAGRCHIPRTAPF